MADINQSFLFVTETVETLDIKYLLFFHVCIDLLMIDGYLKQMKKNII